MSQLFDLIGFAAELKAIDRDLEALGPKIIEKACQIIAKKARDSIQYVVSGNEGCVGSDSPIAVYQELGTSRIPPRSFLVSAAISSEDKIHRMAGAAAVAALSGHGRHTRDIAELLHLLHRAGHSLAELGHDLLEDDESEHK